MIVCKFSPGCHFPECDSFSKVETDQIIGTIEMAVKRRRKSCESSVRLYQIYHSYHFLDERDSPLARK